MFDSHADPLWRLWQRQVRSLNDWSLNVTLASLPRSTSCFALFVPPAFSLAEQSAAIAFQLQQFHQQIAAVDTVKQWTTIADGRPTTTEGRAILTVEGCMPYTDNESLWQQVIQAGAKMVALTWNEENAFASGVLGREQQGVTERGYELIAQLNEAHIMTDVSHANEATFWDIIERATYVVASHSNARALCDHPRNLTDAQLEAIAAKEGVVAINYVPPFLTGDETKASKLDVIHHLDYVAGRIGIDHVGLGSDFDGYEPLAKGLQSWREGYEFLTDLTLAFGEENAKKIWSGNWWNALERCQLNKEKSVKFSFDNHYQ